MVYVIFTTIKLFKKNGKNCFSFYCFRELIKDRYYLLWSSIFHRLIKNLNFVTQGQQFKLQSAVETPIVFQNIVGSFVFKLEERFW